MDELPYLVAGDRALPSLLQNWIDGPARSGGLVVAVAGSSQRMVQRAVLDASAPLYGRARELLHLRPLSARCLPDAFGPCGARRQVELYALWGGIPRYWELAASHGPDLEGSVDRLALDPSGPLHSEPDRLLLEEMPPAMSLRPLLELIGGGSHRLSEMAARLGQPATSLSRPLKRLVDLDLVVKDQPFGESTREGKRTLYRTADPFLRLWFAIVAPNRSLLAEGTAAARLSVWQVLRATLESQAWEELVCQSVPRLHAVGCSAGALGPWRPARRYWRGGDPEYDAVAESVDGSRVLVGEAK